MIKVASWIYSNCIFGKKIIAQVENFISYINSGMNQEVALEALAIALTMSDKGANSGVTWNFSTPPKEVLNNLAQLTGLNLQDFNSKLQQKINSYRNYKTDELKRLFQDKLKQRFSKPVQQVEKPVQKPQEVKYPEALPTKLVNPFQLDWSIPKK